METKTRTEETRSEASAAPVFFFYHIGADAGLQPVPLQRGA